MDHFFFLLPLDDPACDSAEAATVFSEGVDFELLSSLPAFDAGFFPVVISITPLRVIFDAQRCYSQFRRESK